MEVLSFSKQPLLAALLVLPGLLPGLALAQAPASATSETAVATFTDPTPRRFLLKAGLTPSRLIPQYRARGFNWKLAPSVGAEFLLAPHLTLYGQAEVDFSLGQRNYDNYFFAPNPAVALVHSGAIGVGTRYYYSQEARARRNRAHGSFVGNYVALEAATELHRRPFVLYDYAFSSSPTAYTIDYRTQVMPVVTALWGMQRRLGRHFLYDASAGLALLARPIDYYYYRSNFRNSQALYRFETSLAVNLRVYFVH